MTHLCKAFQWCVWSGSLLPLSCFFFLFPSASGLFCWHFIWKVKLTTTLYRNWKLLLLAGRAAISVCIDVAGPVVAFGTVHYQWMIKLNFNVRFKHYSGRRWVGEARMPPMRQHEDKRMVFGSEFLAQRETTRTNRTSGHFIVAHLLLCRVSPNLIHFMARSYNCQRAVHTPRSLGFFFCHRVRRTVRICRGWLIFKWGFHEHSAGPLI